jgi:hypothetical protein
MQCIVFDSFVAHLFLYGLSFNGKQRENEIFWVNKRVEKGLNETMRRDLDVSLLLHSVIYVVYFQWQSVIK